MKKILLVDVDSKIPNLALMKLSTYYKSKGYEIVLKRLGLNYYKKVDGPICIEAEEFNKVYASVIFKNNIHAFEIYAYHLIIGGTGMDLKRELPKEVEACDPDYSIYPDNDCSYGFITRGCIRKCKFCLVPEKEGLLHFNQHPKDIIKHKTVKFLDNNILVYNGFEWVAKYLIENKIRCQFNQGLDIRLLNESKAELLSKLNYLGEYIFAFDNLDDKVIIEKKLELFKKYVPKDWKAKFFLYCNSKDPLSSIITRIRWCYDNKVLPYVMRDRNCYDAQYQRFYTDISAWCNQPSLFKKLNFKEFLDKRHPKNKARVQESNELWEQT